VEDGVVSAGVSRRRRPPQPEPDEGGGSGGGSLVDGSLPNGSS
jgi:hypothetical protein